MNPVWRHMALSLFETVDPVKLSLEEIDRAIERYPYFGILHYLRAGKLLMEQSGEADAATARTALYFSNPLWLNHQLRKQDREIEPEEESLADIMTTPVDSRSIELEEQQALPEAVIESEIEEEKFDDRRLYQDTPGENETDDIIPAVETVEEDGLIVDEIVPAVEIGEEAVVLEDDVIPATENAWEDETIPDEVVPAVEFEWQQPQESAGLETIVEPEVSPKKENEPLPSEPIIPIEPLHTVDYFASQGIKAPVDEGSNDQLSRKLKSFTEWLKSMKKIHPEKIDRQMDKEAEDSIRNSAEHSNENEEVYTEALAEVYLKQGLNGKAREVYRKLSLLDPAKSAYFAARIREIKEI